MIHSSDGDGPDGEDEQMAKYIVSGNTFAHKDSIRATGATWDAAKKVWVLDVIDRGMKRNDSAIYQLRKLSGLRVEAA